MPPPGDTKLDQRIRDDVLSTVQACLTSIHAIQQSKGRRRSFLGHGYTYVQGHSNGHGQERTVVEEAALLTNSTNVHNSTGNCLSNERSDPWTTTKLCWKCRPTDGFSRTHQLTAKFLFVPNANTRSHRRPVGHQQSPPPTLDRSNLSFMDNMRRTRTSFVSIPSSAAASPSSGRSKALSMNTTPHRISQKSMSPLRRGSSHGKMYRRHSSFSAESFAEVHNAEALQIIEGIEDSCLMGGELDDSSSGGED